MLVAVIIKYNKHWQILPGPPQQRPKTSPIINIISLEFTLQPVGPGADPYKWSYNSNKRPYKYKVGPLPVISMVISPLIGVITPVTHL